MSKMVAAWTALQRFDLFPKLTSESTRTTSEGGVISLMGILFALILVISETVRTNQVELLERLELFQEDHSNLTIHLEMTFFHLACDHLELDVSTESSTDEKGTGGWSVRSLNKQPVLNTEGCAVIGEIDISRYESGEMHVALSPHMFPQGEVGITLEEYFQYNTSHEITDFSIGLATADSKSQQRASFERKTVPSHGTGRFVYDFNVVPQSFKPLKSSEAIKSFMFQCRELDVITRDENEGVFALQRLGLPGVFFTVQLSTMMVIKVETVATWTEFLISLLGIVSGTSAIVALVDSLLHETFWKQKLD